jgi:hypothetical protein
MVQPCSAKWTQSTELQGFTVVYGSRTMAWVPSPKHGGADGTRTMVQPCSAKWTQSTELQGFTVVYGSRTMAWVPSPKHGGADGTRTRGLRRDRPAL